MRRSDLAREREEVLRQYHAISKELKTDFAQARATNDFSVVGQKQRLRTQLKKREEAIGRQLSEMKQKARENYATREKLIIQLARKHLGEDLFKQICDEADRLEREGWQDTWTQEEK